MVFFEKKGFVSELQGTIYIEDLTKGEKGVDSFLIIFDAPLGQSFDSMLTNINSIESFVSDWNKKIDWHDNKYNFKYYDIKYEKMGTAIDNEHAKYELIVNQLYQEESNKECFRVKLENAEETIIHFTYFRENINYILHRHNIKLIIWD